MAIDKEALIAEAKARGILLSKGGNPDANKALLAEAQSRGLVKQTGNKIEFLPLARQTLELGGTVFGGIAGTAAGATTSPVTGPAGPVAGGMVGAGLGKAVGSSIATSLESLSGKPTSSLGEQFKTLGSKGMEGASEQAVGSAIGPVVKAGVNTAGKGLKAMAPWVFKAAANVPTKVTEMLAKYKFNLPKPSEGQIETSVTKIQDALKTARAEAGTALNEAKKPLGLAKDLEQRLDDIAQGLEKPVPAPELAKKIQSFNKQLASMPEKDRIAKGLLLREQIDSAVNFSNKQVNPISSGEESTFKEFRKQINKMLDSHPITKGLRDAEANFSKSAQVYDELQAKLSEEGKAQEFLKKVFESDSPVYKDWRNKLAKLEAISGQPLLTDLFKKFAGDEAGKLVGRPYVAGLAAGGLFVNPLFAGTTLIAQSPKALTSIAKGLTKAGGAAEAVAGKAAIPYIAVRQGSRITDQHNNQSELDKVRARLNANK